MDDLGYQLERVLGAQSKPDERNVRMFSRRHRAHFFHVNLAGDDLVAEARHDSGEQLEPVLALVRDQNAER